MKKLFFLLSFMALGALTAVNAQEATSTKKSCAKTCSKSKKSCSKDAKTTSVASVVMAADKAAEADENIERRQCAKTGNVSYYEKATCPMSGKTSYTQVNYDETAGKFVKASASLDHEHGTMEGAAKQSCSKSKEACAKSKASCSKSKKSCAKTCSKKKASVSEGNSKS